MARRAIAALALAQVMLPGIHFPVAADATCKGGFTCSIGTGGGDMYGSEQLAQRGREQARAIQAHEPYDEYRTIDACGTGGSLQGSDTCMTGAVNTLCPDPNTGPLADILIRHINADGTPATGWRLLGQTCRSNEVPGARPRPTMAMIVNAFHRTPWASATLGFEPAGNLTLVNLPSYYRATWTRAGYAPGEIDTVDPATMFGFTVQIRPRLTSFTYHFGDGTHSDPTTSPGGTYPTGDITHTYRAAGTYRAYISVVWAADYRIEDGPWEPIPGTATVAQPAATITVKEARNHLVS